MVRFKNKRGRYSTMLILAHQLIRERLGAYWHLFFIIMLVVVVADGGAVVVVAVVV
jgi:hypothetical protein